MSFFYVTFEGKHPVDLVISTKMMLIVLSLPLEETAQIFKAKLLTGNCLTLKDKTVTYSGLVTRLLRKVYKNLRKCGSFKGEGGKACI